MSPEPVVVAVIGCGRVAGHHCRSIAMTPHVRLAAVCDLVAEMADAYAKEFGVPGYLNYHEMLRRHPEVTTVAVITPSGMHFEHATDIIQQYRRHVIVEKPTFMTPSQVRECYALARTHGVHVFPVFQNRYNKAVSRVRRGLTDGELGPVRIAAVRVRWNRPQRYYDLAPWRGTFAMDGGALTNQGIHHIDLLRHLVGPVSRVNASMRTLGAQIEVEDSVVATLIFRGGVVGTLEVTTAARPQDYEASISLVCEHGLAQIGGIAVNELQVFTPAPAECAAWSEDFSGNVYGHGHGAMYGDLAAFLLWGTPYPVDEDDCSSTIELLHSFYVSSETGSWAEVGSGGESLRLGQPDELLASLYRTPRTHSS